MVGRGQTGFGQGSLRLGVYLGGGTCRQVATSKLYQAALNDLWLEKAVHRLLRYPAKGRYYAAPLARRNVPVVHRTALRNFAVAAGAKRPGAAADIIIERLAALPGPERTIALEQLFLLQSKVTDLALELAAKGEALRKAEYMVAQTLSRAGVVNARSFLGYLADDWPETDNASRKPSASRPKVWKALFRKYPGLVDCLRRDVPTWAPAGMSKKETVEHMAKNIEAIVA